MSVKDKILSGAFDKDFSVLYNDTDAARTRYANAVDAFREHFNNDGELRLFSAPGRTEVGGNHTDHQHGCVFVGAVNLDVIAVVALNNDGIVRIKSEGFPQDDVYLDELKPSESEHGRSSALIRGILASMKEKGYKIGGFDAYTTSNVLKGSGLSSSAAFEVLVGNIVSRLFNNNEVSAVDIAIMAQRAENEFFGKPCGLLDQTASSVGGFTAIDFYDTKKPLIEKVDFDISKYNMKLCIVDTGGNHADLTGEYAAIPAECRRVAEFFGKEYLRDVNEEEFFSKIRELRPVCGDRAVLRAIHFFEENKRAQLEKIALCRGDFEEFLSLVRSSGNSSFKYLQNVYPSSSPDEQGLSLALALAEKVIGRHGACRVHGGGFAGTIQIFVPCDKLEELKSTMESVFGEGSFYELNIRPVGGTEITCK